MTRPPERIPIMLNLLRRAWEQNPDQRLGQLIANAARDRTRSSFHNLDRALLFPGERSGNTQDVFNVEDDHLWEGLQLIVNGEWDKVLGNE